MRLTRELAQKIVENTMSVLGKNINIMNHDGVIIGSGNKKRINTYHEVASIVLTTGEPTFINQGDVSQFKGVKAGINLPIKFNEKIIGVVGITGNVDEVSGYGQIVKNMVELILQREFLQQEIGLENKVREDFYQQLLSDSIKDRDLLHDRTNLLKISNNTNRAVYVIRAKPFHNKEINGRLHNSRFSFLNEEDIFLIRGEFVVLIKTLNSTKNLTRPPEIFKIANHIEKVFQDKFTVTIGIGPIFNQLERLYLSYQGAKHALRVGEKIYHLKPKNIFYINQLGYDYFLPCIEQSAIDYYLNNFYDQNIIDLFVDTEIGIVLEALAENDLNISKAAEQLFIHRNTLLYRLKKIEEKTGLDPKKAINLFSLLFAYNLYLYSS